MRKLLLIPLVLMSPLAYAQIGDGIKESCMEAKDFVGCVKAMRGDITSPSNRLDFLGEPVIDGWVSYEDIANKSIVYINPADIMKVKVRSLYGRYFYFNYLQRYIVPAEAAVAATPGMWKEVSPERKQCTYRNNKRECTTVQAVKKWKPGKPGKAAQPEYVANTTSNALVDCLEKTAKWSNDQRRWRKETAYFIKNAIAGYCYKVDSLNSSQITKYADGKPTSDDIKFTSK